MKRSIGTLFLVLLLGLAPELAPAQPFTYKFHLSKPEMRGIKYGSVSLADADRDGRFDFLVTGQSVRDPVTHLYLFEEYTTVTVNPLTPPVPAVAVAGARGLTGAGWFSTGAWGDYDGDNDLDLVLMGARSETAPFEARTQLYENRSSQLVQVSTGFPNLFSGSAAWGDYDRDGDLDLLLTGATGTAEGASPSTTLFENADGTFREAGTSLPDLMHSAATWGDYDGDGDFDLALSGVTADHQFLTDIYRNDDGSFTPTGSMLPDAAFGTFDWGDYDSDGDLDLLFTGARVAPTLYRGTGGVYRNDNGSFAHASFALPDAFFGGNRWGDFNNDGRLDFVLMGHAKARGSDRIGRFYSNTGSGFEHVSNLKGVFLGTLSWGDVDGDNDLDLLTGGSGPSSMPTTSIYRNTQLTVNQPPAPPEQLAASAPTTDQITLNWAPGTDPETPSAGLTYNLRVGTAPGKSDVVSPAANLQTGRRYLPDLGNVNHNTEWTLTDLEEGTYYWSVQTLDNSFVGSPFSEEQSFIIGSDDRTEPADDTTSTPTRHTLYPNHPNPFSDQTVIEYDLPAASRVTLHVYNTLGQVVRTLVAGHQTAGRKRVIWNGRDESGSRVAAGVYVYRLQASSGWEKTGEMVVSY